MKQGWVEKKLGEIYNFKNGINFNKNQKNGTGILTIDVLNMYGKGLCVNVENLYRVNKEISENYKLQINDILIVRSSVKEEGVAWATYYQKYKEPVTFCGFIIRGRAIIEVNAKYVIYYLRSPDIRDRLIKKAVKSTITNINQKNLSELTVPIAPLSEQKHIVAKLDQCFEAIDQAKANVERNLQNAKELFQSQLNQIFSQKGDGWVEKKLRDVCEVIAGQSPESKYYNSNGTGLPFYQGKKEFRDKYIGEPTTWTSKITKEAFKDDILMSVRAPVGPINFSTQHICIGRGLAAIRAKKYINKEYLFNFLFKHENEIEGNTGAVFNSINKAQIGSIPIPIPPLPEQEHIVAKLERLSTQTQSLESNYLQELNALDELKKSILQKAFNGEL